MALKGHDTKAPKVGKADSHPKSPDQSSLKSLLGKTFTSVSAMIGLLAGIAVFTAPFAKSGSALLKETLSCAAIIFLGASILITLTAYRKERLTIRAPVAAGTTILLLAIGIVGGVVIRQPGQPAKNPVGGIALASPVASASATTGSTTCAANLQITSPANGVHIIHKEGVDISVRACGLVNEYGWVFNYDDSDKYYHEDYIQHSGPIIVKNGDWQVEDIPIGSENDHNTPYTIVLVLADQKCNSSLLAIKLTDGDYRTRTLTSPSSSCKIAAQRTVLVSGP